MESLPTEQGAALSLGAFTMDELGWISLQDGRTGGFGFRWRGRPMTLELQPRQGAGVGECRMRISARIGRVPSTALAAERRPEAFDVLRQLPALLPVGWTLALLPDHGLKLSADATLALPAVIGALIVPATRFALEMAPYLDVLEQYGVAMNA